MHHYLQKNHGWRDAYNPLRGLNMSRLTALQKAGRCLSNISSRLHVIMSRFPPAAIAPKTNP